MSEFYKSLSDLSWVTYKLKKYFLTFKKIRVCFKYLSYLKILN